VLACTISALITGTRGKFGSEPGGTLFRVTDHDRICIPAHDPDGIGKGLPFAMEQASTLPTESDVPPRRAMADSKDMRVRVLGSKKRTARILPRRAFSSYFFLSICAAWSSRRSISVRSKSPIDMICRVATPPLHVRFAFLP